MTIRIKRPLIGRALAAFAIAAAVTLGAARASADTPIDPKLYLPALKDKDSFVVITVNVQSVLKLDAVKKAVAEKKVNEGLAKSPMNLKIEDFAEVAIIISGDIPRAPTPYAFVRLTKDAELKDISKDPASLGDVQKISGYDVYELKDKAAGDAPRDRKGYITKVDAATFLIAPETSIDKLTPYLKQISAKKASDYPEGVAGVLAKVTKGDINIIAGLKSLGDDAPEAAAVSFAISDSISGAGAIKMKTEALAKDAVEGMNKDKEGFPIKIPNLEFAQDGTIVTVKASANAKEIEGLVDQLKGMLPGFSEQTAPATAVPPEQMK